MPRKTDSKTLGSPFLKRSAKLLPCQKEMILYWRERGESQRSLARMFNVSRRLITFVLDPEKQAENLKRRAERGGSKTYYNKEKHRECIRNHRKYKHEILKDIL